MKKEILSIFVMLNFAAYAFAAGEGGVSGVFIRGFVSNSAELNESIQNDKPVIRLSEVSNFERKFGYFIVKFDKWSYISKAKIQEGIELVDSAKELEILVPAVFVGGQWRPIVKGVDGNREFICGFDTMELSFKRFLCMKTCVGFSEREESRLRVLLESENK